MSNPKGFKKKRVEFSEIVSLFDSNIWDVGYLSASQMDRAGNTPIKAKFHLHDGIDLTSHIHNTAVNGIVLVRHNDKSGDYRFYEESFEILRKKFNDRVVPTYSNFKESALLSGLGYRAKNSLIYNRKFGFQSKICVYMFVDEIVNHENLKPNEELLDLCNGCNDCIKNCPAGAIHENWVDARKCDNFIGFSNHPTIPSTKWFWYEKIGKLNPTITKKMVRSWSCFEEAPAYYWGQGVDGYYEQNKVGDTEKDGEFIEIPHCRECVCQPRCSKAPIYNQ